MSIIKKTLVAGAFGLTLASGMAIGVAMADQPAMNNALGNLRQARNNLQNATGDKGGHRIAALNAVNAAIAETEAGIAWDRRH
ncbi:MAG: hypothetical protein U1E50_18200 [Caulobacteraceae bacterium]